MHYNGDFRKSCEKVFSPPSKLNKFKTFSTQNWFNGVSLCWYNQSAWLAVDVHELCWLLYHKDTLTFEIPAKVSLPYCCCIDETVLHNQLHSSFLLHPPPLPPSLWSPVDYNEGVDCSTFNWSHALYTAW